MRYFDVIRIGVCLMMRYGAGVPAGMFPRLKRAAQDRWPVGGSHVSLMAVMVIVMVMVMV